MRTYDVAAIGNAIVDILFQADDAFLNRHGIAKGAMTLIDGFRAETLAAQMTGAIEVSGGSAANTTAGIGSFGGHAAFIGKVHEDRLGEVYLEDLKRIGVAFSGAITNEGASTGCSYILVTPDGQRSMNTYLGCAGTLRPQDIDTDIVAKAQILYIEGYLWDQADTKAAIRKAIAAARAAGTKVALTLSDSFCVGRWRQEFRELMASDLDILFANEGEAKALFETQHFDEAFQAMRAWGKTAAITRSEKGSVVVSAGDVHLIDADPIDRLADTTGAGDLFAAGFLFGLSRRLPLARCGQLGSLAAAECIQHLGPRPQQSLRAMAAAAGLV